MASTSTSDSSNWDGRAAQKLNLSTTSSPHRRKRYNSEDSTADTAGFCGVLQRSPPPVPLALLRRIGVKEVTGVGKVKVMLRVSNLTTIHHQQQQSDKGVFVCGGSSSNSFFNLDKRKKQVNLIDPSTCGGGSGNNLTAAPPEDRRVGVAAPKMFAFDAIFSQDDSQTEVCSSALTDVIHAVINGTDGCLFCFGHAGLGKSYTMLGTAENANTLGIIPCAIAWLFKGINEQKQKTCARFSVRVSALEVCGLTNQMRDLLAGYANDSEQSPGVYLRDDPLFGNQPPHCELRVPTAEKAAHYLDAAIECRTTLASTNTSQLGGGEDSRDSHLLFTLHVYQYSVAGKGGVAGGRSRLHLIDLGNSERGKASGGIPLSGLGNILLAIFNGQKHLPYKEHKLTQLLKDCLGSLTCHAAMIAHVSPQAQNYSDTLTTVQLASRIHRMRRRRIKFVSTGGTGGHNNNSGSSGSNDDPLLLRTNRILMMTTIGTGTSSEPDPSSSDLSADTVIYVGGPSGAADDATDGEHPPVYIPSLNSGDNRCAMGKALRGSSAEERPVSSREDPSIITNNKLQQNFRGFTTSSNSSSGVIKNSSTCQNNKTSPAHHHNISNNSPSPSKSSPNRIIMLKQHNNATTTTASDEQWIDGPRISKSKVAEARHYLMKESSHVKNVKKPRETWIDGPMQQADINGYGYMDSHKKNMIRKWVEHQTSQIQETRNCNSPNKISQQQQNHNKELTQFIEDDEDEDEEKVYKPLNISTIRKQQEHIVEESAVIRTGLKMMSLIKSDRKAIKENYKNDDTNIRGIILDEEEEEEEETVEIPPPLPLIEPLSSREVSLESLDILLKERMQSNAEYYQINNNRNCGDGCGDSDSNEEIDDFDEILEIVEVEEPLEPVPTQDSCLQVTEEDIALCMMGYHNIENPLPEVDQQQQDPFDHPLRILSQENLTIVSTFTDSMSVYTDLERILPRERYDDPQYYRNNDDDEPTSDVRKNVNNYLDENTKKKFDQLARLHQLYTNRLAKANVTNSETYQKQQEKSLLNRCESLSLTDILHHRYHHHHHYNNSSHDNNSIYSEPVYNHSTAVEEKFCENCKINIIRPATAQNWYTTRDDNYLSLSSATSIQDLSEKNIKKNSGGRFPKYSHTPDHNNLAYLRHPDGASNPNLMLIREKNESDNNMPAASTTTKKNHRYDDGDDDDDENPAIHNTSLLLPAPLPPPNSLPSIDRTNRAILNLESGVLAAIKLTQNNKKSSELGYDSGHDSTTPQRTSKHSPAAISRRAESGYDSVVRDSEISSIDSEDTSASRNLRHHHHHHHHHHRNHGGKCKHMKKHEKSFCSWFLNPFTCKYIVDDPPETHF